MKSRAIILAAAVTACEAVPCNVQPGAEEIQAQKDKVDALNRSFQMRLRDVQDSLMAIDNSMDEKREAFSRIIEAEAPVFKEQLLDILKKNRRNEAGLYAYCNLENFVADESELEEPYAMLSKSVRDSYESFKDFTVRCMVPTEEGTEEQTLSLSDFVGKGKYILVDFWASWSGPCCAEIPNIAAVYDKYAGEDFDVLSIAVWDTPDETFDAADSHGVIWNQMVIVPEDRSVPTDVYGIKGIPQIMLFGPDGRIVARGLRGENIEKTIAKYVQGK